MKLIHALLADTAGTSSIEYACIAAVIAIGSMVGIQGLGAEVGNSFADTTQAIIDAQP
jgi:Flp pilus assembly pilin Flp